MFTSKGTSTPPGSKRGKGKKEKPEKENKSKGGIGGFVPNFGRNKTKKTQEKIPPLFTACIAYLETCLKSEGLFRTSGGHKETEALWLAVKSSKHPDLSQVTDFRMVADIFKRYFRESPDSLLTYQLYNCWVAAIAQLDQEEKVQDVRKVLGLLPSLNLKILKLLIDFLTKVVANSQYNKMDTNNLARMFGPNILRTPDNTIEDDMSDISYGHALVTLLMEEHPAILQLDKPMKPKTALAPPDNRLKLRSSKEEFNEKLMEASVLVEKGQVASFVDAVAEDETNGDGDGKENDTGKLSIDDLVDMKIAERDNEIDDYLKTLPSEEAADVMAELEERLLDLLGGE